MPDPDGRSPFRKKKAQKKRGEGIKKSASVFEKGRSVMECGGRVYFNKEKKKRDRKGRKIRENTSRTAASAPLEKSSNIGSEKVVQKP